MYEIIGFGLFAVYLLCTIHMWKHRANMNSFFIVLTLLSVVGGLGWFCFSVAHTDIYRDNPATFGPPIGLGLLTIQMLYMRIKQISSYLSGTHKIPMWFLTFVWLKLLGYYLAMFFIIGVTCFLLTMFLKETILP
jgi:hypothetical protein